MPYSSLTVPDALRRSSFKALKYFMVTNKQKLRDTVDSYTDQIEKREELLALFKHLEGMPCSNRGSLRLTPVSTPQLSMLAVL